MTDERPGTAADRARWRRYLADERAEAAVYRELAARRDGEEREILLALAVDAVSYTHLTLPTNREV